MELESFYQEEPSLEAHFKRLIEFKIHELLGISEAQLEEALYSQDHPTLLHAFIHTSYTKAAKELPTYERLEYLGDSIIYFLMSNFLYQKHPFYSPGQLSLLRQKFVSTNTLIEISKKLNLHKLIFTTPDLQVQEFSRILADVFESFVGAVFMSFGLKTTERFVENFLILPQLDQLTIEKDYKTTVQEIFQEVSGCKIIYSARQLRHDLFVVDLTFCGITYGSGVGKSKKVAEQNAASAALEKLCGIDESGDESEEYLATTLVEDCMFANIKSSVDSENSQNCEAQNSLGSLGKIKNSTYELVWSFSSLKVE